ncbi:MAG: hypothetical protein ACTSWR_10330 [Candidatus Helarchaeota archaeon]
MEEIIGLWLLNEDGKTIFSIENYVQGSEDYDSALFSGFVLSVSKFSSTIGEKKLERIEFGNSKIFLKKDKETNLIFVLRTIQNTNNKKMERLINNLNKKFNKKFKNNVNQYSFEDLKTYLEQIFITELKKSGKGSNVSENLSLFLEKL